MMHNIKPTKCFFFYFCDKVGDGKVCCKLRGMSNYLWHQSVFFQFCDIISDHRQGNLARFGYKPNLKVSLTACLNLMGRSLLVFMVSSWAPF
jgi:hypothetical protein